MNPGHMTGTDPAAGADSLGLRVARSPLQDALTLSTRPGIISFSLGFPAPELFPSKEFSRACADVLGTAPHVLQYGEPLQRLKYHIVALMRTRGVACKEEQVFLTHGAQQGVNLLVTLLMERGRQVIAEEICYPGFQHVLRFFEPEILPVPTDFATGMDVDCVERYLVRGARPAFIYAIPDGHNPLGVSLSEEKRTRLLTLSQAYGVPILEADPYGFLSYTDHPAKPMRASSEDDVFYINSFSKILAPSTRVGWLIVPERLVAPLANLKEASDINMATFAQHVVARMLDVGFLPSHLQQLRSEYKLRRDAMLSTVTTQLPVATQPTRPQSGVFVWVQLPEGIDTARLLKVAASEHQVAFMPGSAFSLTGGDIGMSSIRLSFSFSSVERIEEGIRRLSQVIASAISHRPG
jgi:2-aminoadipate transaminase